MPMRWTPENDQLLLLKILETHDLSVDTNKVASAWPGTDDNEKPTPRAIRERLVKMRQIVKASGSDGFTIGGSETSTPKKAKKTATPIKTPGSKRKRGGKAGTIADANENATSLKNEENAISPVKMETAEDEIDTPTKKKPLHPTLSGNQAQIQSGFVKTEGSDQAVFDILSTPTKRSRKASVLPAGMVSYDGDEQGEDDPESSASEFLPDEAGVKMEDMDMMNFA
ncbi:hypothetical protein ALT_8875 [Aspergillus lentulus]|uniref:Uncharacterized protein n=1 Tax=Aspergillus lentulus TaxID=293939 RepID=A0AAN4TF57_ASPLE|nr:uncharacterized protein IFM58399_04234 [Aspergillus lentulus]KAF4166730.1 hypothetical protein CNMCM6936_006180 [Aspergillus lentulus]KAF4185173.1 hypothetical protein CNMCM7927_007080 [Aspergillus lentulus]GAQ11554.1 hypothetical protein ALT_8875 [Aspergillus lentulus]GFF35486.1 hypothetical protein IFM58399_04234 [Aspergillus lentulus]GFF60368.1 hypothetical protein IFM62136_04579 [Aspergillus lentulus]